MQPRVVVITGASSGIGAATAVELARRGCTLVLGARRADKLDAIAAKCRELGAKAEVVVCDVAKREDVERLIDHAVGAHGRIDVLIANAGYGFLAKIHETTDEQFDDIVATNVKGTFWAMRHVAPIMQKQAAREGGSRKSAKGHIIAISSGAGRRGLPLYGVYSMTKAAQLSLAEAMRVEWKGTGVYVSTVHPLTTATEFFEVASSKSRLRSTGLNRAQPVEVVARKIARLIERPRPELWPVTLSNLGLVVAAMWPGLADFMMGRTVYRRTR